MINILRFLCVLQVLGLYLLVWLLSKAARSKRGLPKGVVEEASYPVVQEARRCEIDQNHNTRQLLQRPLETRLVWTIYPPDTIDRHLNIFVHHTVEAITTVAKMTAQCALYMGALKIFGTP